MSVLNIAFFKREKASIDSGEVDMEMNNTL